MTTKKPSRARKPKNPEHKPRAELSPPKSVVREPVYLPPEFSASIRLRSQEEAAPKPPPPPPWYREHWQNLAVVIAVAFLAGVCWSSWPGLDRLAAFVGL